MRIGLLRLLLLPGITHAQSRTEDELNRAKAKKRTYL